MICLKWKERVKWHMTAGMVMLERLGSGPSLCTKTVITEKCYAEVETDLCSLIPALRESCGGLGLSHPV